MVKTISKVQGTACGMCEAHVNDAVRKAFSVKKVTSSHAQGQTEIITEQPSWLPAIRQKQSGRSHMRRRDFLCFTNKGSI